VLFFCGVVLAITHSCQGDLHEQENDCLVCEYSDGRGTTHNRLIIAIARRRLVWKRSMDGQVHY